MKWGCCSSRGYIISFFSLLIVSVRDRLSRPIISDSSSTALLGVGVSGVGTSEGNCRTPVVFSTSGAAEGVEGTEGVESVVGIGNTEGIAVFTGPPVVCNILTRSNFMSSIDITSLIIVPTFSVSCFEKLIPRFFCKSFCTSSGRPQKNSAHAVYCDIACFLMSSFRILWNCVVYDFKLAAPFALYRLASTRRKGIWYSICCGSLSK